jgi:hypothetical protein
MDSFVDYIDLGAGSSFPVVKNLWDFFSKKGSRTVFFSVGQSSSPALELHISENLGCKIHIFVPQEKTVEWEEIQSLLKTRKVTETTSDFAKPAIKRWVLPTNITIHSYLPSFEKGEHNLKTIVDEKCKTLDEKRIDILKIEVNDDTAPILYGVLHYGFRPGILLVSWEKTPDNSTDSSLLAGHLQNVGYALVCKSGSNFLYYFNDKCVYDLCSWEDHVNENPLITKIFQMAVLKSLPSQ